MGGHPKLSVRQVWNEQSKTLRLTVTQTQKADSLTPSVFRLPMDVEFDLGSAKESGKLNVTKRVETFSYKLPRRPSSIKVDPQEKIPVKMVKLTPSAEK
jgi:hypothetical protein